MRAGQVFKQYLSQAGFIGYFSCLFVATGVLLYLRCDPTCLRLQPASTTVRTCEPRLPPAVHYSPAVRLICGRRAVGLIATVVMGCPVAVCTRSLTEPQWLFGAYCSLYTHFGTDYLLIDILICSFTGSMTVMATKGLAMFLRTVRVPNKAVVVSAIRAAPLCVGFGVVMRRNTNIA